MIWHSGAVAFLPALRRQISDLKIKDPAQAHGRTERRCVLSAASGVNLQEDPEAVACLPASAKEAEEAKEDIEQL